jgi:hypothetical protein
MWLVFSNFEVACPFMIDFFKLEMAVQHPTDDIDSELESLEDQIEVSLKAFSVSHEI